MIKLAKLPERTLVRITLLLPPALHDRLVRYASAYAEAYGVDKPLPELIRAMLSNFLDSDRTFQKDWSSRLTPDRTTNRSRD